MIPLEAGRDYSSFKEREKYEFRVKNISLNPGKMPEDCFEILIELSAIHSQKIINALRDYLVSGDTRKVSCERHGANISYFSIALGRLFRVSQLVSQLAPYYCEEKFYP